MLLVGRRNLQEKLTLCLLKSSDELSNLLIGVWKVLILSAECVRFSLSPSISSAGFDFFPRTIPLELKSSVAFLRSFCTFKWWKKKHETLGNEIQFAWLISLQWVTFYYQLIGYKTHNVEFFLAVVQLIYILRFYATG